VLLEGTNLSEGRGTTTPFEICGAPYVDPYQLRDALAPFELPGVAFRPIRFEPTFHKWKGQSCGGLFLHVTDSEAFRPYRTTLALLAATKRLWPDRFAWKEPPYEYEQEKRPIDCISGGDLVRASIDRNSWSSAKDLDAACDARPDEWRRATAKFRLYE
jgi:uncharacterized protein YbbC (DUF1343 family)